jgi:hypothetical protein
MVFITRHLPLMRKETISIIKKKGKETPLQNWTGP